MELRQSAIRGAQHEMGHYIVARALGFRTGEVSIELRTLDDPYGFTNIEMQENLATMNDIKTYLQRRSLVLFAGSAAETLPSDTIEKFVDNDAVLDILHRSDRRKGKDLAKARELINILRNISQSASDFGHVTATQDEPACLEAKLLRRAAELVENYGETIVALGCALAMKIEAVDEKVMFEAKDLERIPSIRSITVIRPF